MAEVRQSPSGKLLDLDSSDIANVSAVPGVTVTAALDNLAPGGVVSTNEVVNVSSVPGANATAALDDLQSRLTTDGIQNTSTVPGLSASAALDDLQSAINALAAALASLGTNDVDNQSSVAGATATDALDALASIIAALTSSEVANASAATGPTVTTALDGLVTSIANLSAVVAGLDSSDIANVSLVSGSTVTNALQTLASTIASLDTNDITNVSTVVGGSLTAALDTLNTVIGGLDSTDIANASSVTGANVTLALNSLLSSVNALSAAIAALDSTDIANLSSVAGATVTAALNTLLTAIGALTSTSIANASSVSGATVTAALNTLLTSLGALTSTNISNASSVTGATVTAALNTLLSAVNALAAAIAALDSSDISNLSSVTGATVTAALDTLLTSLGALTSTNISNVSSVSGATVTAALNTLLTSLGALSSTNISNASTVTGATVTAALNTLIGLLQASPGQLLGRAATQTAAGTVAPLTGSQQGAALRFGQPQTIPIVGAGQVASLNDATTLADFSGTGNLVGILPAPGSTIGQNGRIFFIKHTPGGGTTTSIDDTPSNPGVSQGIRTPGATPFVIGAGSGGLNLLQGFLYKDPGDSDARWWLFPRGHTRTESIAWEGAVYSWTCTTFTVTATGDVNISSGDDLVLSGVGGALLASQASVSAAPSSGIVDVRGDNAIRLFANTGDLLAQAGSGVNIAAGGLTASGAGDGDIVLNATSGVALTQHSTTPVTGVAGVALSTETSNITLSSGVAVVINTASTQRVTFESDGSWNVGGSSGNNGDTLTSTGSGAPPVWEQRAFSSVTALTTTTANTTPVTLATKTFAANEAVAGTAYRFVAEIQVARGATATATGIVLELRVGGVSVFGTALSLNVTNGYTGMARIEGEIFFRAAPGAAAAYTIGGVKTDTIVSSTPNLVLSTPLLTLTAATNAPLTVDMRAWMTAATAAVSFTPVSAYFERIIR